MEIGEFSTPINKLESLGNDLGFRNLYLKRDDLSCRYYGGNKVRKLEWVLADAKVKGRKTLLTIGGIGSNQVLSTAIYGQKEGFKVVGLIFDQLNADYVRRNLLFDYKFNVEFVYALRTRKLALEISFF
jgi:D-cysteine desulfhydrase